MNFMIDIETFSTRPNGVIASVGACAFSIKNGIEGTFYSQIAIQEQLDKGRKIDEKTLVWWLNQSESAQRAIGSFTRDSHDVFFDMLKVFIESYGPISDAIIWANGAAFDPPFLEDYFRDFGLETPWNYTNVRCFRTYAAMTKCTELMTEADNIGTHHNAVDDSIWQATAMIRYMTKGK